MAEGLAKRPGGQTGDNNVGRGSTEQPGAGWWEWQWMCRRRALGRTIWGPGQLPWATLDLPPPATPGAQNTCPSQALPVQTQVPGAPRSHSNCSD